MSVFHLSLRSCRVDTSVKEERREGKMARKLVEANEPSLAAANWCFNLWLWLSWCLSLPAGRLRGVAAEQTWCPQTFFFTSTSFLEMKKKKRVFILHPLDRQQSNWVNFFTSASERCSEVSWGREGSQEERKEVKEGGQMMGWRRQECVSWGRVRSEFAS